MARGTYILPNFPNDPSPPGSALFGTFGNDYRYILPNFPISQKTTAQLVQHFLGNWETGKWLQVHTGLPISKRPQPRWSSTIWEIGKLGNCYRYILDSQFPNFSEDPSSDGPAPFGKLANCYRYILPNFPTSHTTPAQMTQH